MHQEGGTRVDGLLFDLDGTSLAAQVSLGTAHHCMQDEVAVTWFPDPTSEYVARKRLSV
jgi:hypothetical protein